MYNGMGRVIGDLRGAVPRFEVMYRLRVDEWAHEFSSKSPASAGWSGVFPFPAAIRYRTVSV